MASADFELDRQHHLQLHHHHQSEQLRDHLRSILPIGKSVYASDENNNTEANRDTIKLMSDASDGAGKYDHDDQVNIMIKLQRSTATSGQQQPPLAQDCYGPNYIQQRRQLQVQYSQGTGVSSDHCARLYSTQSGQPQQKMSAYTAVIPIADQVLAQEQRQQQQSASVHLQQRTKHQTINHHVNYAPQRARSFFSTTSNSSPTKQYHNTYATTVTSAHDNEQAMAAAATATAAAAENTFAARSTYNIEANANTTTATTSPNEFVSLVMNLSERFSLRAWWRASDFIYMCVYITFVGPL